MEESLTVTMDAAGRIVIPAAVRRELALAGGVELVVTVEGGALHLRPTGTAVLATRGRRLVISGALVGPLPDHRDLREERTARISGS